jgi:acyl-CoA synthetase (NDP forming)
LTTPSLSRKAAISGERKGRLLPPACRPDAGQAVAELLSHAIESRQLGGSIVPEPFVKDFLRKLGIPVVRGAIAATAADLPRAASDLRPPLVLKAWGPEIIHKSDIGAVRLGQRLSSLLPLARDIDRALRRQGIRRDGFLVEEQASAGTELIMGVVRREPLGCVAVVGLGGTMAEVFGRIATRLCPLSPTDVADAVDSFLALPLRGARRGGPGINRTAMRQVLSALTGIGGVTELLGDKLREFECNPVIVTSAGAVVADARLALGEPAIASGQPSALDFNSLFRPASIAVVGASATRTTLGNRALRRYRAWGWDEGLYAIHPQAASIEGVPAVPSLADLPGGVDYLLVVLPAQECPSFIRAAAGHARVAQVLSAGFRESGPAGARTEMELVRAARKGGLRFLGPNCLGVYAPTGRQTLASAASREPGILSVVLQSGGLAGDLLGLGARRGLRFAKVVSAGNAADTGIGELADYLADDAETAVIGIHVEGCPDRRLAEALRRCRAVKPAAVLAAGVSTAGRQVAQSHTGALTGDRQIWSAFGAYTGAAIAHSLEEFVAVLAHLDRFVSHPARAAGSVLVIGVGGGASVLAADACDAAGLTISPLAGPARRRLASLGLDGGALTANPIDAPVYQGAPAGLASQIVAAIVGEQDFGDVLLHIDVAMYYVLGDYSADAPGVIPLLATIEALAALPDIGPRLIIVLRNIEAAPGADADLIAGCVAEHGISAVRTFAEATAAIAALQCFDRDRLAALPGHS